MEDRIRQFLYATALVMMVVVLWATNRASQLEAQVRSGWLDAPRHVAFQN